MELTKLKGRSAQVEQSIRAQRKERAELITEARLPSVTEKERTALNACRLRAEATLRQSSYESRLYKLLLGMLRGTPYCKVEPKTRDRFYLSLPMGIYDYLPFTETEVPQQALRRALGAWMNGEVIVTGDEYVRGITRCVLVEDIKRLEESERFAVRVISDFEKQLRSTRLALAKAQIALNTILAKAEEN